MSDTSTSSTAILCIARNELPFTEEWLEYHIALGFDRVHYVSTDDDFGRVEAFFDRSPFRDRVDLHHFAQFEPGWQIRCYNQHLPAVEQDWLMVLDLDEFLVIDPGTTIADLVAGVEDEVAQVQFPWVLALSDEYWEPRVLDVVDRGRGYVSDHVKSLVRRDRTRGLGVHAHDVVTKTALSSGRVVSPAARHRELLAAPAQVVEHPFVLHLYSRGLLDVLTRLIDQRFFNAKGGQGERERLTRYLEGDGGWADLPNRFLLLKFYESLPAVEIPRHLPATMSGVDLDELIDSALQQIATVVDFTADGRAAVSERFEARYGLARKLGAKSVERVVDLDRYLELPDQLSYVRELRDLLVNR